ncbi:MAG: hypothetical protein GC164_00820 [Phycisphaera sp.]|nr:hypothetical protein [Phycisphaera sp.]
MQASRLLVVLAVAVCLVVAARTEAAGEKYNSSAFHYRLDLPDGWVLVDEQVTRNAVEQMFNAQTLKVLAVDACFQRKDAPRDFAYPYLMVQVLPYDRIGSGAQPSVDELEKIVRLMTGVDVKKSVDRAANKGIGDIINNAEMGVPVVDKASARYTMTMKMDIVMVGEVHSLCVGYFGKNALVQVYGYSLKDEYDKWAPEFEQIARSLVFEPGFAFDTAVHKSSYTGFNFSGITGGAMMGALVGGLVGLVLTVAKVMKKKKARVGTDSGPGDGV